MKLTQRLNQLAAAGMISLGLVSISHTADAFRMIQNDGVGRFSAGALVTCNDPDGFVHWDIRNIDWRYNPARQGSEAGGPIASALQSWTQVGQASHNLSLVGTTSARFRTDGINGMSWARGNGCSGNCLALTALVLEPGQVIVETDVTFNERHPWNTNGSNFDIEAVAAHEVGHALGIHHTEQSGNPTPTMNASYFGTAGRSLENDDESALQCSESRY